MEFFRDAGKMSLGSRVRSLADLITRDAASIYEEYGTELQPKWFPVFYALTRLGESSVTAVAEYIGHSHVSASKIIGEMSRAGLITEKADASDRRRTHIKLSKSGLNIARKIETQYLDVDAAIEDLCAQATHNLWAAIEEWETLLNQKSLRDRVLLQKTLRVTDGIKIHPYRPKHKKAFYDLNVEWISKYFELEPADHDALDNPKGYILDRGGFIFVAMDGDEVVGVCALLKREDLKGYELAKMAVSPKAQRRGIGFLLGQAAIDKSFEMGAKVVFLESNTKLKPAVQLYKKLGFKEVTGRASPYSRCNLQMELSSKR
jgi:DNA-binding MarR family transcriptional regulator/GNAT superfamily N-acetyltransferase